MSYSQDLRERVVKFVNEGGSRNAAAQRFGVNRQTVSNWMQRLASHKPGPRTARKLDMALLDQHVATYPDALLTERAAHFGMSVNGIWCAMKRLNLSKKNVAVR